MVGSLEISGAQHAVLRVVDITGISAPMEVGHLDTGGIVVEAIVANGGGEGVKGGDLFAHDIGNCQPAQAIRDPREIRTPYGVVPALDAFHHFPLLEVS